MAFWQWLKGCKDHVQGALPARTLFWSSDFVMPVRQDDPPVQLFCICPAVGESVGEDAVQVLRGVTAKRELSVLELKKEVCLANPDFAEGTHDRLQLRFPGLKVERPYSGTLLKHVEGLRNGALVFCSWAHSETRNSRQSSRSGAQSEQDACHDERVASLLRDGCIFPALLRFESEQTHQRRPIWRPGHSANRYVLLDGKSTSSDLSAAAWALFEADCRFETRMYMNGACHGPGRCHRQQASKDTPGLNFYMSSSDLHWQHLEHGVALSGILCPETVKIAQPDADLSQVAQHISKQMALGANMGCFLQVLCGAFDNLYYEAQNYPIGPWGREVGNIHVGPARALPAATSVSPEPFAHLPEPSELAARVRTVSGEVVLELSREKAELLTVLLLKVHIREATGAAVYRQKLAGPTGSYLQDEDLLPLCPAGGCAELTLVLSAGHPAAVSLDGIYFGRTKHEHEGKPVYHGHLITGTPSEVLWISRLRWPGWVLRPLLPTDGLVREPTGGELHLGAAATLAEIAGASVLSLDGSDGKAGVCA